MKALKRWIVDFAAGRGYHIGIAPLPAERLEDYFRMFLERNEIDIWIDVGANVGGYGQMVRSVGYHGPIISFEPVKPIYETLRGVAENSQPWETHCLAIGDRNERRAMNIMTSSLVSSFREPSEYGKDLLPERLVKETTDLVDVRTLDSLTDDIEALATASAIVLKTDSQGYDLQVLRGASSLMDRVVAIQVEAALQPIYEGVPSFDEMLSVLRSLGFEIGAIFPVQYDRQMRTVEVDLIGVKVE